MAQALDRYRADLGDLGAVPCLLSNLGTNHKSIDVIQGAIKWSSQRASPHLRARR
jgi:hypothetical protein